MRAPTIIWLTWYHCGYIEENWEIFIKGLAFKNQLGQYFIFSSQQIFLFDNYFDYFAFSVYFFRGNGHSLRSPSFIAGGYSQEYSLSSFSSRKLSDDREFDTQIFSLYQRWGPFPANSTFIFSSNSTPQNLEPKNKFLSFCCWEGYWKNRCFSESLKVISTNFAALQSSSPAEDATFFDHHSELSSEFKALLLAFWRSLSAGLPLDSISICFCSFSSFLGRDFFVHHDHYPQIFCLFLVLLLNCLLFDFSWCWFVS